jgi:hypothetical protein
MFLIAPSTDVNGSGFLTSLASVALSTSPVITATGTKRVFATADISAPFTPTGASFTPGPTVISGSEGVQFLIAPVANFNTALDLISLTGCFISTSKNLTGLVSDVSYRVVGLTVASSTISIVVAPDAFTLGQWSVIDADIGGTLRFTFSALPYNGGSAITNINIYENGSGTPIATGLTAPGQFDLTGRTNDVSYSYTVKAVNAIGPAVAASDTKAATPTASAGIVPNQVIKVGARTLANAGRVRPIGSDGVPVNLLSVQTTAISGTLGSYVPTIVNGGIAFALAGCPAGNVTLRATHANGTVDITLSPTGEAESYYVATWAELLAAISNNNLTAGRTIYLREGDYTPDATRLFGRRIPAPGLTISGMSCNHLAEKWPSRFLGGSFRIATGTHGVNLQNFAVDWPLASGSSATGIIRLYGDCSRLNYRRLRLSGKYQDPTISLPESGAVGWFSTNGWNGTVEECLITDVIRVWDCAIGNAADPGPTYITCNEWRRSWSDGFQVGGGGTEIFDFRYNVGIEPCHISGAHVDTLFQAAGSGGISNRSRWQNVKMIMNVTAWPSHERDYNNSHGTTAFDDSVPEGSNTKLPIIFENMVYAGNFIAAGGANHMALVMDGGTIAYNTVVNTAANSTPAQTAVDQSSPWFQFTDGFEPVTAPRLFNNILERVKETLPNNNLQLGRLGTTIPYSAAFGPNAAMTVPAKTWAEIKQKWTPIVQTRGAFSEVGVYGTPRDKSTWSFDESKIA